jgi:hypothetical protein
MANYAVMDGNKVINTLVADSKEVAEEVSGNTCIEFTNTSLAFVGGIYDSTKQKFIKEKPSPSWVLNEDDEWVPPIPIPNNGKRNIWNEETSSWDEA